MKYLIKKILKEIEIKQKNRIGLGSFHAVYPYNQDPNKVIKIPRSNSDYAKETFRNNNDDAWFNVFKKYPDFFPKIYKITDKYILIERLDVEKVKNELQLLEDDLYLLYSDLIDDGYNITEIIYNLLLNKDKNLKNVIKTSKNKTILKKYIDLLSKIIKSDIKTFIDVNDNNFGYTQNGVLKMLDI